MTLPLVVAFALANGQNVLACSVRGTVYNPQDRPQADLSSDKRAIFRDQTLGENLLSTLRSTGEVSRVRFAELHHGPRHRFCRPSLADGASFGDIPSANFLISRTSFPFSL
jgi:hypothetical protein